jgi:predicted transcriptional regulator
MSPVKEQVMNMVGALPDDVTIDDILAEIYFKGQVDAGLKELDAGQSVPHEDVEKRMSKWLSR